MAGFRGSKQKFYQLDQPTLSDRKKLTDWSSPNKPNKILAKVDDIENLPKKPKRLQ